MARLGMQGEVPYSCVRWFITPLNTIVLSYPSCKAILKTNKYKQDRHYHTFDLRRIRQSQDGPGNDSLVRLPFQVTQVEVALDEKLRLGTKRWTSQGGAHEKVGPDGDFIG